jgi:hypothetical protein
MPKTKIISYVFKIKCVARVSITFFEKYGTKGQKYGIITANLIKNMALFKIDFNHKYILKKCLFQIFYIRFDQF